MGIIKRILMKLRLYSIASKIYNSFKRSKIKIIDNRLELEQMIQVSIMNQYKILSSVLTEKNYELPKIIDTGFKVYSQFDEDGILLYLFSLIGFTNRKVVEICCGHGAECNTANLIINHACYGLLFDGDRQIIILSQINQHGFYRQYVYKHG